MNRKTQIDLNTDYKLIPLSEITDEAREIAVMWCDHLHPHTFIQDKHKLASDIMNYARRLNDGLIVDKKY